MLRGKTFIASVAESYDRFWGKLNGTSFNKFISGVTFEDMEEASEKVRKYLLSVFTGGGVSASSTREAFATIGDADTCNERCKGSTLNQFFNTLPCSETSRKRF